MKTKKARRWQQNCSGIFHGFTWIRLLMVATHVLCDVFNVLHFKQLHFHFFTPKSAFDFSDYENTKKTPFSVAFNSDLCAFISPDEIIQCSVFSLWTTSSPDRHEHKLFLN